LGVRLSQVEVEIECHSCSMNAVRLDAVFKCAIYNLICIRLNGYELTRGRSHPAIFNGSDQSIAFLPRFSDNVSRIVFEVFPHLRVFYWLV
jgi:hypothetical protein